MTFAGMAMTRVGERPRQREPSPSFRAIFRNPSNVELNVFWRVSSIAQSAMGKEAEEEDPCGKAAILGTEFSAAMQKEEVLLTQKTSRQHAVTPRFGGSFPKGEEDGKIRDILAAAFG